MFTDIEHREGTGPATLSRRELLAAGGLGAGAALALTPAADAATRRRRPPADAPLELRSDSASPPTQSMMRALAAASTACNLPGLAGDPTVKQLEQRGADLLGKEAAVYLPSGIAGNQIALLLLVDENGIAVTGVRHHVSIVETMYSARKVVPVTDLSGLPDVVAARAALTAGALGKSAIFAENPLMVAGALVTGAAALRELASLGVPVHLDGARLFSAALALRTSARELAAPATTVMLTLSKGLRAPVGSLLAGPAQLIDAAREQSLRRGGAWAKPGPLAAAGLLALKNPTGPGLQRDHALAAACARAIAKEVPGIAFGGPLAPLTSDPATIRTALIFFGVSDSAKALATLEEHGVLATVVGPTAIRLAFHAGVDQSAIPRIVDAVAATQR